MGKFTTGFQSGVGLYNSVKRNKREEEEMEMARQRHATEQQRSSLEIDDARRRARINAQIDEENVGLRSHISGTRSAAAPVDDTMQPDALGNVPAQAPPAGMEDDQAGLNRRLMSIAALKGDYGTVQTLSEKNRELGDLRVFNSAVQQFSVNPESFTEYTRWVNRTNPLVSAAPARDPRSGQLTGYNIMTVTPSGDAVHKFISPQQAATLAGATALMRTNPSKALQIIGTVDQSLAASIAQLNSATEKVTTTGNTATHNANTDATSRMNAESNRIQANASVTNAQANKARAAKEKQTEAEKLQEKVDAYSGILMRQNPKLSKTEADKQAAGILLRDPNAKETDVGLAEAGIFRVKNKYFRMGKNGEPEEVRFDGGNATLDALRALAESGQDPFAPKPKKGREVSGKVTEGP